MININDVAMGLNNICRFGGQIPEFYSVLQHSLLVYALAPKELGAVALLHDASEAYLGDVIKPLKVILDTKYTDIEDDFTAAIFNRFYVDIKLMPKIKQYDKQALEIEHDYFFNLRPSPLKNILAMFEPAEAKGSMFYPLMKVDWIKIFTDLVWQNCPGAFKMEA